VIDKRGRGPCRVLLKCIGFNAFKHFTLVDPLETDISLYITNIITRSMTRSRNIGGDSFRETTPCQPQCSKPDWTAETRQKCISSFSYPDLEQWHSVNAIGSTDDGILLPPPGWRFRGKINFCLFSSQTNSKHYRRHSRYMMPHVRWVLINWSLSSTSFFSLPNVNNLREKLRSTRMV